MDNEQWNNVLLEWVNCLKLAKTVHSLEELKTGDFFLNLQKVITKSSEPNDDILPFIFGLFAKHYPQYLIKSDQKSQPDLAHLPLDDVKDITTLLMHYTCIYDRRDVLTSPLCHYLSNSTQLVIKSFLEKINSDVSNEDLNRIVMECMSEVNKHKEKRNGDSFIIRADEHFSPLQDLLRTPIAKPGRLQERDRIISKLKSDIEIERYEKADLQEELRIQRENLKKIENQLTQKNAEMSRLRDEIATLESTAPPNDKTEAVRELQKRLKAEIQSLEQYIRQTEAEQETIRQERDVANNKLKTLESQVVIWQEKFFETEQNFETLTENSKKQADELDNLRAHCSELTTLLEEYRSQPKGHENSSFLENYVPLGHCGRSSQSCEDLACSVVEVQLRDVKKQNEELESALQEAETRSIDLRKKIQELTSALKTNEAELLSAQNSNQDLQIKFETVELQSTLYKQEVEEGVERLREITQIADQRKEELLKTESERNALGISLEQLKNQLEISLKDNKGLLRDLEEANKCRTELSIDISSLKSNLEEVNVKCDQINNHKEELLIKVETLELEYTLSQNNLSETKRSLEEKADLLDRKLNQLESVTAERKQMEFSLELVKNHLNEAKNNGENLQTKLDIAQEQMKQLQTKLEETLKEKEGKIKELEKDRDELVILLHVTENKLSETEENFEKAVEHSKEQDGKINSLEVQLEEKNGKLDITQEQIKQLQAKLEETLKEKEVNIKELEEARDELVILLQVTEKKLSETEENFEKAVEHSKEQDGKIHSLEVQLEETNGKLDGTQEQMKQLQAKLEETLNDNEGKIKELEKDRDELVILLHVTEKKLSETEENFEKAVEHSKGQDGKINSLEMQLEETNGKLDITQEQMKQTQTKLEETLKEKEEKIQELEKDRDELVILLHVTEKKLSEIEENFEKAVEHSKGQDGKISSLEMQLEETNGILTEAKSDLAQTVQEKVELNVRYEEVKERLDLAKVQVEYLGDELKISDEKCERLESEKINLTEILEDLKTQHDLSQAKLKEANECLEHVTENSKEKNMEITTLMIECENVKHSFENTKDCLGNMEKENETLKTELVKLKQQSSETIEDLQLDICEIHKSHECLTKKNDELLTKLQELQCNFELCQENLRRTEADSENLLRELQISQLELENMRKSFEDMSKEYEATVKQKEELAKKNRNLVRQLDELNEYSTKLLEEIQVTTCSFEESEKKCQILCENEARLLAEVKMVQCKYEICQEKLMKTENELKMASTNNSNTLQSMKDYLGIMEGANEDLKKHMNDSECKLKNAIEDLLAQLDKTRTDCENLELDKTNLEQKVSSLQMQCRQWAEKHTGLENKHVQLLEKSNVQDFEINEMQITSSNFQNTIADLKNQLEIKENQIEALDSHVQECRNSFKDEIDTLSVQLQKSRDNVDYLSQCKNELILQIQSLETDKQNVYNILTSIQKQLEDKTELLRVQKSEAAQLQVQRDELQELCKQYEEGNVDLKKRLDLTEKNYEEVENRLTEHIGLLQNARHDAGSLLDKLEELEEAHRILERLNTELKDKLVDSEREFQQNNSNLQNLEEERRKLIENLEKVQISADLDRNTLHKQIDSLKETVAGLEKEVEKMQENETESGMLKAQLDEELKITLQKLCDKEEKCVDLQKCVEELQEKIQVFQTNHTQLEEQREALNNELKVALQKYENTCKENNAFDQQLIESQELISELQNKICELIMEKAEVSNVLSAQVLEYEQKCKSLERSLEDYCALFKEHEIAVQKYDKDIMMLEKEQENSNRTIEKLINEISEKQNEIAETKARLIEKDQGTSAILSNFEEKCLTSEEHNKELVQTAERLQGRLEESRQIQKNEIEKREELSRKLEMSEEAFVKLQSTFEILEFDCQQLKKDNEELLLKLHSFEDDKEIAMKEHQEKIIEMEEKLKQFSTEKQSLLETIDAIKDSHSIANAEKINSMQDTIKKLEEMTQDYEITISGLKGVVESNLDIISELRREKNEISNLLDAAEKNKVRDEKLVEVLKKYEIVDEAANVPEMVEEVLGRNKSIMENLQSHNSIFYEMVEKIQAIASEKIDVDASLEVLQDSLDKICTKIKKALEEKDKLSEESKSLIQEKNDLAKELDDLKARDLEPIKLKAEKENVLVPSNKFNQSHISKEEDLKKKNLNLKQKLVLAENAKSNLEKKLKVMREESKKSADDYSEIRYKNLLRENAKIKEDSQKKIKELEERYENLRCQFEEANSHGSNQLLLDLNSIREAYGKVVSTNSKLELEIVSLRRVIEQRNGEIGELCMVKEAYEKLLEDNNKLMTELDTVKYKRSRDKDEYIRLLRKERDEAETQQNQKVRETRVEMEGKLQAMKDKMLRLYRDEMEEEKQRLKAGHSESRDLLRTVIQLKSKLSETEEKVSLLEMERDMLKSNKQFNDDYHSSFVRSELKDRNSIRSLVSMRNSVAPELPHRNPAVSRGINGAERASTLPRFVEEQITISRRTSMNSLPSDVVDRHNMQMEDEEDLFNNKYLTDLKEGRCEVPAIAGRESVNSRFSELAWRNSMVPQHLKSSYPAETQFYSPGHFKEDDIKASRTDFESSSIKLLPNEKPRKKDFGTTSYKRPGPPTPSKNGGRLSLQGNEVHPVRLTPVEKTPKRATPGRLRALFTSKNSTKDMSDNNGTGTPSRSKRLNIFRKPK